MKIKANLLNKPVNFQMDDCQIEKVVELPRDQFSALVITPLTNQPFIAENKRWMFADDSAVHCLLVLGQGSGDGVLIYSAGYDYPRLAAYLPGMRDIHGPVPSSVDSAVPYSNEKSVGNPPIGPAGSTISRLTNVRSRRSRNLNLNVPSSACITSCGITECQSSPNCSQTSRQPKTGNCSGAWTSWN